MIGVLDVIQGTAVHARGGQRENYRPLRKIRDWAIPDGNPVDVARAYVEGFGIKTLYVADIDAIQGGPPQYNVVSDVSNIGCRLIVDGGIRSAESGRRILEAGASHVVVGLETLPSFDVLEEIVDRLGGNRVAFSVDLRSGHPIFSPSYPESESARRPVQIAERAVQAGVETVFLIDLARVGTRQGLDMALIEEMRTAIPRSRLIAGGGIRSREDLASLSKAGCDGALVATALVSGHWLET